MSHILLKSYSKYYDFTTNTEFNAILDQSNGCYVAYAETDNEDALKYFNGNNAFEVLSDEEFDDFTKVPEKEEKTFSETGDPLTDPLEEAGKEKTPEESQKDADANAEEAQKNTQTDPLDEVLDEKMKTYKKNVEIKK